ncbi:MAG TPA: hypothetical protein VEC57_06340 [Candidatus Limnocylindrales bacterium]|nr:hypothetical protein [Candidatus Limnocylindrales bacterium]
MNKTMRTSLMAAAVAGLFLSGTAMAEEAAKAADKATAKVKCHGVNACKGTGGCGGAGHACAGKNACKGQGFTMTTAEECKKLGGKAE